MPYILSVLLLIIFTGCANISNNTPKQLDSIVIVNHTDANIKNAAIYAKVTQRKMQCGLIPKQGHCAYEFFHERKTDNSYKIVWSKDNTTYTYDNITLSHLKLDKKQPIRVAVNLLDNGTYFIQTY